MLKKVKVLSGVFLVTFSMTSFGSTDLIPAAPLNYGCSDVEMCGHTARICGHTEAQFIERVFEVGEQLCGL